MNIKKYIKLVLLFLLLSWFNISFSADLCEYKWQIDQCIKANEQWKSKSIEDFVCINWKTYESIAYQVILDLEFQQIDDEMDKYLENLESQKDIYFGPNKQKTYLEWIDDISDASDFFKRKYEEICSDTIVHKFIACSSDRVTNINVAKDYFSEDWLACQNLINTKMEIFDDVSFDILMLNKLQVNTDSKKTYDQVWRNNYNNLLDIMMINLWYLERIWQKWPMKIWKAHK